MVWITTMANFNLPTIYNQSATILKIKQLALTASK
jgi:hypothetical protein